jgi:hypothetical protein
MYRSREKRGGEKGNRNRRYRSRKRRKNRNI